LEKLDLTETLVTGKFFRHIRKMPKLTHLGLNGCTITDDALPALYDLTTFRLIRLENTEVTQAGVDLLKKALPGCTVIGDGD
jgi:hypothetical protein